MKKASLLFLVMLLVAACVDRLAIDGVAQEEGTLVVDGLITDAPGPYQVRLFRASVSDAILNNAKPVFAKEVLIFDDLGNTEVLSYKEDGLYETAPDGIRGRPGRKYGVRIKLLDGTDYESQLDEMNPVGSIDSLYYEWEAYKPLKGPPEYGFRIFSNTRGNNPGAHLRWRFSGTYVLETFPQFRRLNDANCGSTPPPPDPPPCSGWVYNLAVPGNRFAGGSLEYVGECTCCICWVTQQEKKPTLSEDVVVTDGTFANIEVGYVSFDQWTFGKKKYMVKVEQMSLSPAAYDFWQVFKDQKEGSSSLFQPAFGRTTTNLYSTNSNNTVMGIFYAAAIRTKVMFLTADDAKVVVPPYDIEPKENCVLWSDCERLAAFPNGLAYPPPEWE
ncbi:MAG: DUF4249 domain-containing protein [Cyclobacteriaceae bacterium]|nr:DUF4249 domain-containing protein [Cyclobacteriaceae bacterium]